MAALGLTTAGLLSGCAREPVLAESTGQLESDVAAVLGDGARRLGQPGARPRTLADQTQSCPGGRRRVLRRQVALRRGASPGVIADRAAGLALDLITERGYRLTAPPAQGHRVRTFTMTRDAPEATLTVRLHGGRRPTLMLDGATPCLPG